MSSQPPGSDEPLVPLSQVEQFYRDVLHALGEHARRRGATAQGAAAVAKRVAKDYGLPVADRLPLPRLTRAEREDADLARGSSIRSDSWRNRS